MMNVTNLDYICGDHREVFTVISDKIICVNSFDHPNAKIAIGVILCLFALVFMIAMLVSIAGKK